MSFFAETKRFFSKRTLAGLAAVTVLTSVAPAAQAQSSADGRRWEIEGYGGLAVFSGSTEGAAILPPAGPPIATSSPIFPSRRVPSWFFGDGASLLNQVNGQFGAAARIQPLDAALGGSGLAIGNGFVGGVRVRRTLTARFAAEFSFDMVPSSGGLSDELATAAEASRASFAPAFEGLLATGPFDDVIIGTTSMRGGSALQAAATGALVYSLGSAGGFDPYLTFGGGVITGMGDGASVILEGRTQFRVVGEVPFDETDRVTIRHETRTVVTAVVGAGLRRDMSDRWGIRIDGRVLVGPAASRLLIDADPAVVQGAPADFIESFTAPSIQFSNNPSTGRDSSLGGPPLQDFETFKSDGVQARVLISAGVFVRF